MKTNTKMPENLTLILVGVGFLLLLAVFYYYINRQVQNLQTANVNIMNHVLYQQKIIEKHDQLLNQNSLSGLEVPLTRPPISVGDTRGFSNPVQLSPGPSTEGTQRSQPVQPNPVQLAPMVGSLLNIFTQLQKTDDNEDATSDDEEEVAVEPLSTEELSKEISRELEELKQVIPLPEKKEGRVDTQTAVETS